MINPSEFLRRGLIFYLLDLLSLIIIEDTTYY